MCVIKEIEHEIPVLYCLGYITELAAIPSHPVFRGRSFMIWGGGRGEEKISEALLQEKKNRKPLFTKMFLLKGFPGKKFISKISSSPLPR